MFSFSPFGHSKCRGWLVILQIILINLINFFFFFFFYYYYFFLGLGSNSSIEGGKYLCTKSNYLLLLLTKLPQLKPPIKKGPRPNICRPVPFVLTKHGPWLTWKLHMSHIHMLNSTNEWTTTLQIRDMRKPERNHQRLKTHSQNERSLVTT